MKVVILLLAVLAIATVVSANGLKKEVMKKGDCSVVAKSGDNVKVCIFIHCHERD